MTDLDNDNIMSNDIWLQELLVMMKWQESISLRHIFIKVLQQDSG